MIRVASFIIRRKGEPEIRQNTDGSGLATEARAQDRTRDGGGDQRGGLCDSHDGQSVPSAVMPFVLKAEPPDRQHVTVPVSACVDHRHVATSLSSPASTPDLTKLRQTSKAIQRK